MAVGEEEKREEETKRKRKAKEERIQRREMGNKKSNEKYKKYINKKLSERTEFNLDASGEKGAGISLFATCVHQTASIC